MSNTILRLAPAVVLPLLFIACSSSGEGPGAPGPGGRGGRGAGGPVPVVTARVQQKAMPVNVPAVGNVEPITSVQIRSQVTGQLGAIHFTEGQDVQKGQRLFTLDQRTFQAALQQAQAVLARDQATLQNAQAQQSRLDNLFQRGLIPKDQYETQRANVAALTATVDADKAAVENARLNVQYAEIKAPLSGRTGALMAHVGDLVRANDTTALVVINQVSPVYVTFAVPGRFLGDIRRYQARKPLTVSAVAPSGAPSGPAAAPPASAGAVTASAGAGGGGDVPEHTGDAAPARGTVTFIDNTVDAATGTIRLKATFPNADRQLWPGAFVQVTLQLTTDPDAVVVPAVAVQASQEGQYVYVVKADRTVEMRAVVMERQQGDQAVITRGVSPGETVVTDGHLRLTPGARIAERGQGPAVPGGPRGGAGTGRGNQGAGGAR